MSILTWLIPFANRKMTPNYRK